MGSGGAGGGSTTVDLRNPNKEQPVVGNWYDFQNQQFQNLVQNNPLLNAAGTGALDFFNNLGQLTGPLQNLYGSMPSIQPTLDGLQNQFGGLPNQLLGMSHNLGAQFGNLPTQLQKQFGGLPKQLTGLTPTLVNTAKGNLSDIIRNRGALTQDQLNASTQQSRLAADQSYGLGSAPQVAGLVNEVMNRQNAQDTRYANALNEYNAATGQVSALDQAAQGLGTNLATTRQGLATGLDQARAGLLSGAQGLGTGLAQVLSGLRGSDIAQRTGLAGAIQNLQSGGLNQLNTTAQTQQNVFSGLENPILSYLGNLFSNNLQGSIAQAGINQQGNIANQNKNAGLISGALSSIGSIAGGLAMSDERVKTKIKPTDLKTPEGIPMKTFEYRSKPGVKMLGVVAQDVEKKLPDRVLTDPVSGMKFVVGFPMIEVSPPKKKAA